MSEEQLVRPIYIPEARAYIDPHTVIFARVEMDQRQDQPHPACVVLNTHLGTYRVPYANVEDAKKLCDALALQRAGGHRA